MRGSGEAAHCPAAVPTSYKWPLVKTGDAHVGVLQFVRVAVVVLSLAGNVQCRVHCFIAVWKTQSIVTLTQTIIKTHWHRAQSRHTDTSTYTDTENNQHTDTENNTLTPRTINTHRHREQSTQWHCEQSTHWYINIHRHREQSTHTDTENNQQATVFCSETAWQCPVLCMLLHCHLKDTIHHDRV